MSNNEYRIIQINNYVRTREDYLKVKKHKNCLEK